MLSVGVPRVTIAKVLNHISADAGVTAIYDRHSYDAEKRRALELWAHTVETVTSLKSGERSFSDIRWVPVD